jgi:hypothetical protein
MLTFILLGDMFQTKSSIIISTRTPFHSVNLVGRLERESIKEKAFFKVLSRYSLLSS